MVAEPKELRELWNKNDPWIWGLWLCRKDSSSIAQDFSGIPAEWEDWSWNFKSYISMFDSTVKTLLHDVESRQTSITDADMNVTLDTGDLDQAGTTAAVNFSRKLHYLLANLTTDSARLIVRQNFWIQWVWNMETSAPKVCTPGCNQACFTLDPTFRFQV